MTSPSRAHSDPSHSETINFYLREGRCQRSNEVWNLIHTITRSMGFSEESQTALSRHPESDESIEALLDGNAAAAKPHRPSKPSNAFDAK